MPSGSVVSALNARQKATMYDLFLNLKAGNAAVQSLNIPIRALNREHHAFKSKDTHLALSAVVVGIVVACVLSDLLGRSDVLSWHGSVSQSPSQSLSTQSHLVEIASLVAGAAAVALFAVSFTHRSYHAPTKRDEAATVSDAEGRTSRLGLFGCRRLRRLCLSLDLSSTAVRLANDSFIVFLTLFAGLTSVARAVRGGCNDSYSQPYAEFWFGSGSEKHCNVAADLALETYAMCLFVVLLPQVFFKSASRTAICLSW